MFRLTGLQKTGHELVLGSSNSRERSDSGGYDDDDGHYQKQQQAGSNASNLNYFDPVEVFRLNGDLPHALCVDVTDGKTIGVATLGGIREFNIESALTFRRRTSDKKPTPSSSSSSHQQHQSSSSDLPPELTYQLHSHRKLAEDDLNSWEAVLHRFAQDEQQTILENLWDDDTARQAPMVVPSKSIVMGGPLGPLFASSASSLARASSLTTYSKLTAAVNVATSFSGLTKQPLPPPSAPEWLSQFSFFVQHVYPTPVSRLFYLLYRPPLSTLRRCQPSPQRLMLKQDALYATLTSKPRISNYVHSSSSSAALSSSSSMITMNVQRVSRTEPVAHLVSHPTLPLYFSASASGQIRLWHFGLPHALRNMADQGCNLQHITRLRLSSTGARLAAAGANGRVSLWAIVPEGSPDAIGLLGYRSVSHHHHQGETAELMPFQVLRAHSKICHDLTFVQGASILITAGESSDGRNVCVWDTLKGGTPLLYAIECHHSSSGSLPNGATSLCVLPDKHRLLVGGVSGALSVVDLERRVMVQHIPAAHASPIRSLIYDSIHQVVISTSGDGEVKIWNPNAVLRVTAASARMQQQQQGYKHAASSSSSSSFSDQSSSSSAPAGTMLELQMAFPPLYEKRRFFNLPSSSSGLFDSHGLMDATLLPQGHLVVCGSDGTVKYIRRKL